MAEIWTTPIPGEGDDSVANVFPDPDYQVRHVASLAAAAVPAPLTPNEKRDARKLISKFLRDSEAYRNKITYSQARPFDPSVYPSVGYRGDCSSYATQSFYYAWDILDGVPLHDPNGVVEWDGYGWCHDPAARLLTTGLRWTPAGDIRQGDEVWALDESPGRGKPSDARRRFRRAAVIASFGSMKECVRVCLDTGESFVCSSDHPWLSKESDRPGAPRRWTPAIRLLDAPILVRPFMPWEPDSSYEAGWLAGMFDGEGWVRNRGARGGRTQLVEAVQAEGPTATRLVEAAQRYGSFCVSRRERAHEGGRKPQVYLTSNGGGMSAAAEFLGRIRPERLISSFNIEGGYVQATYEARAVKIERVGEKEVQSIQTTAGTYIAEGFAVHNTGTLLSTNHGHRVPLDRKFYVGDIAIFGTFTNTKHATICRRNGYEADAVFSSHGTQAGPVPTRLLYRNDLVGVYRPLSLL